MPVSMKDIARAAGVTESTISRALANSPRVKLETRRRIQRIAREMGYVPSAIARGLATNRTSTLGVVVMDSADPFIAAVVGAIDKSARDLGYSIILSTYGPNPEQEMSAIRLLLQQRVDAIIIPDPLVADSSLPRLEQVGIPIILLNKKSYVFSVGTDSIDGARQAVEHLLGLGHRRIAYIGGSRSEEESAERRAGYEQALIDHGICLEPSLIVEGDGWSEGGRRSMHQLLALPSPPTAVFCFNDLTASGVLLAAYGAGVRIPQDLSVVGFDDSNLASLLVPPLTTVAQQSDQMARLALQMALDLMEGNTPSTPITLPGKLVTRKSTAPLPNN